MRGCTVSPGLYGAMNYNGSMSEQKSLGTVTHENFARPTDYLFRISIKCLIRNANGDVLVVKEAGRDWWDLPGGGMDHGENLRSAIARELKEEVNLGGSFSYRVIYVDEPAYLRVHDFWQLRLVFEVQPENLHFSIGRDADEVEFIDPLVLKDSGIEVERRIFDYASIPG